MAATALVAATALGDTRLAAATSIEKTEGTTGTTELQVSRWRRRLKEPEKYRAMLFGAAYGKTMAERQ